MHVALALKERDEVPVFKLTPGHFALDGAMVKGLCNMLPVSLCEWAWVGTAELVFAGKKQQSPVSCSQSNIFRWK